MFIISTSFPVSYEFCDVSFEYPTIHFDDDKVQCLRNCVEFWDDLLKSNIDIECEDGELMSQNLTTLKRYVKRKDFDFDVALGLFEEIYVFLTFVDTSEY